MDSSFIFIDGPVLWMLLIYLLLQFVMFCILGNAWIKAQRECDRQDKLIKKLRADNNTLLGIYQRDIYKLPEVDDDG